MLRRVLATVFLCTALPLCHAAMTAADLGRLLFFDANLSLQRTQSCASCHDESRAFSDGRDNGVRGAASLGDDGRSLGDRNAPALTYVALTPPFRIRGEGQPAGGFFLDGRVATLQEQAAEPFVRPTAPLAKASPPSSRRTSSPASIPATTGICGASIR
jgi:cytochrome c peroxidase